MQNVYNIVLNRTNSNSVERFINLFREGAIILVVLEIFGYRVPSFLTTSMNNFLLSIFYLITSYKIPLICFILLCGLFLVSEASMHHRYLDNLHHNFWRQLIKLYKYVWIIVFTVCLLATNLESLIDFKFIVEARSFAAGSNFWPTLFRNCFALFMFFLNIYWFLVYFCNSDNALAEKHPRKNQLNSKGYIKLSKRELEFSNQHVYLQIYVRNNESQALDDIKEYFLVKQVNYRNDRQHKEDITIISQFASYSDAKNFMNDYADEPSNFM
ncbi:hypothetical protein ACLN1Y_05715 [Apilactobacillus kunkeei]|uniref:hypothetical protein n=1 Tax=Apilactobacillus kunkeei TaxID=148814 RepID=UPI0039E12069